VSTNVPAKRQYYPKVSDVFADTLKRNDVPYLFGIPGGGSAIDLIESCKSVDIPFVLVQHETTAAMAAAVTGELTGTCGVCVSIMGPGATNLAGGASYSLWERHAVISLTEAYPLAQASQMSLQLMDHSRMFSSFSKASEVLDITDPAGQLVRLMTLAKRERPGPVHLDLPNDLLNAESGGLNDVKEGIPGKKPIVGDLDAIVSAINRSEKPVLVIGPAVVRSGASQTIVELAEKLRVAVLVTSKARGVIPETHPLFAGVLTGIYHPSTFEGKIISSSDLVVAVGLDRMELLAPWRYQQPIVSIDSIDTSDEQVGTPLHTVHGSLGELLALVIRIVKPKQAWDSEELSHFWNSAIRVLQGSQAELNAAALLVKARDMAPDDTILVTETGIYNAVNLFTWKVPSPDLYFGSSGANTMGFALPAVIASSLVRPLQKTIALVGDGGFLMKASELETLARLKLAPTIIVFNDGTLGLIRVKQEAKGYARDSVDLASVDIAALARSFGGWGEQVHSLAAFESAFERSLQSDRFTVIDARLDPVVYASHMEPIRG